LPPAAAKEGEKERGAAGARRATLFLSFGVGWGTHTTTFERKRLTLTWKNLEDYNYLYIKPNSLLY